MEDHFKPDAAEKWEFLCCGRADSINLVFEMHSGPPDPLAIVGFLAL